MPCIDLSGFHCLSFPLLQRYLMALLTAVHQHNSGAAARAQRRRKDGSGGSGATGAVAAAVAPLAEALGERQLQLSCCSRTGDVLVTVVL